MKKLRRVGVLILALGVPGLLFAFQVRQAVSKNQNRKIRTSKDVLMAIPRHSEVLINIHRRLFPATWDITLLGQRSTKALREGLLGNTQGAVRWKCAQILTQLRDASARPTLHRALSDWNKSVRGQVLRALAELGDKSSVPFILNRFKDPHETIGNRVQALRTLGKLGDSRAIPVIVASYQRAKRGTSKKAREHAMLRRAAVRALWDLRTVAPDATLKKLMREALGDDDVLVARKAAIAAGELQDRDALPALEKLLGGESAMLRNVSAYVMGQIGDKRAIASLVKALQFVRSGRLLNNITFALQRLGDPKLLERLSGFLRHRQAFIRLNAAYSVGDMKVHKARFHLEQALKDPNVIVRNQAIIALAKLRDRRSLPALFQVIKQDKGQRRWLAQLAVFYISQGKRFRKIFVNTMLSSRSSSAKRKAALLLASFGDLRAAPYLFYLLRGSRSARIWKMAKDMKSGLLDRMFARTLSQRLSRGNIYQLSALLEYVGTSKASVLKEDLLATMIARWYRPSWRQKKIRRWKVSLYNMNGIQKSGAAREQVQAIHWGRERANPTLQKVLRFLGYSKDKALIPWFHIFLYHRSYHVRTEALLGLALLGDEGSVRALGLELANASDRHRPYLVERLGLLPTKRLRSVLKDFQGRNDPYLNLALSAALLRSGAMKSMSSLIKGLRQPQYAVRMRARSYLKSSLNPVMKRALWLAVRVEKHPVAKAMLVDLLERSRTRNPAFSYFHIKNVSLR